MQRSSGGFEPSPSIEDQNSEFPLCDGKFALETKTLLDRSAILTYFET